MPELHAEATRPIAAQMLSNLIEAVPYRIHTVLTDNRKAIARRDVSEADKGIQFTRKPGTSTCGMHSFDRICVANGIEHRLAQPIHP